MSSLKTIAKWGRRGLPIGLLNLGVLLLVLSGPPALGQLTVEEMVRELQTPETQESDLEPRRIGLKVSSKNVRDRFVTVEFTGPDADKGLQMYVLVDRVDTTKPWEPPKLPDLSRAVWQPFSPKFEVDLGPGDGLRKIQVGVQGIVGRICFRQTHVKVDNQAPEITITHPTRAVVAEPVIQIQGSTDERLMSSRYELVTEAGDRIRGQGFTTANDFDLQFRRFTRHYFQFFDVDLAPGRNVFTLSFTDLAGNVTEKTLVYSLDYSVDKTPPEVELIWPQPNDAVATEGRPARSFRVFRMFRS